MFMECPLFLDHVRTLDHIRTLAGPFWSHIWHNLASRLPRNLKISTLSQLCLRDISMGHPVHGTMPGPCLGQVAAVFGITLLQGYQGFWNFEDWDNNLVKGHLNRSSTLLDHVRDVLGSFWSYVSQHLASRLTRALKIDQLSLSWVLIGSAWAEWSLYSNSDHHHHHPPTLELT